MAEPAHGRRQQNREGVLSPALSSKGGEGVASAQLPGFVPPFAEAELSQREADLRVTLGAQF